MKLICDCITPENGISFRWDEKQQEKITFPGA